MEFPYITLVKKALTGWKEVNANGKFMVLLLGALLYLWYDILKRKKGWTGQKSFLLRYRLFSKLSLLVILILCPATAALLMIYQTGFYEYAWLWSWVPISFFIALAGTEIFMQLYFQCRGGQKWKAFCYAVFGVILIFLCGNLGSYGNHSEDIWAKEKQERESIAVVLDDLTEGGKNNNILLWASREFLEYSRMFEGSVRLIYGRNMWEEQLNKFSYDSYPQEIIAMYQWMEGEGEPLPCVQTAISQGVNTIILPKQIQDRKRQELLEALEICKIRWTEKEIEQEGYLVYQLEF